MAITLIEDTLATVVRNRLAAIKATPALLDDVFAVAAAGTRDARTQMEDWFAANAVPEFRHGYPRIVPQSPYYSMVLRSSNEVEFSLGDDLETSGGTPVTIESGVILETTIEIITVAASSPLTRWLHDILIDAIRRSRTALLSAANGWLTLQLSSGDLQPNEQMLPEFEFFRSLRLVGRHEETWTSVSTRPIVSFDMSMALPEGVV